MNIARLRQGICRTCDRDCPVRATIDHADESAACPSGRWRAASWRATQRQTPSPSLPPLTRQLANASGALQRVGRALVKRQRVLASDEVIAERREICAGCPQLVGGRCAQCGCFYKAKVTLATENCPLGHWKR